MKAFTKEKNIKAKIEEISKYHQYLQQIKIVT